MHHFVTWARRGRKSKRQQKTSLRSGTSPAQPKGWDEKKDAEATDPPACCHFDLGSGDVSRLNSTPRSINEDTSVCKTDAITGRPASDSSIHSVGKDHDHASPNARADPPNPPSSDTQRPGSLSRLRRSKSVFTTLSKSLRSRVRSPPPPYTRNKPVSARSQNDPRRMSRRMSYRPQAVPVGLSNDPASRVRRDAALRARGLLPPQRPRDLSAIEADADRRIDALGKNETQFSGPDNSHSDANEIAQSWRIRNTIWLSDTLPNSDSPRNSMTEDTSTLDTSNHSDGSSGPPTVTADPSGSLVLTDLPSILGFLSLGSTTHFHEAASSRGSIGHHGSRSSRAASPSSASSEGWKLPSFNLEDLATGTPTRGISGDTTAQSAPASPASSCAAGLQVAETPEVSAPSQRSVTPSLQLECSFDPLPSEPHNVTVQAQLTIPAASPIYLLSTVSDSFLPSPTTPTLSQSVCYSSSETEDGSETADNGDIIDSPVSPTVMNDEGGLLCQETIVERSESPSDDDDIDTFHDPPSPSLLTVTPRPTEDGRGTASRRTPGALLSRLKTRGATLPPLALSKSTSMVNLGRTMSGSLFGRNRTHSTVSRVTPVTPQSPPPSPLVVKMYDRVGLSAEASRIIDDEARRLSELAFMS